MFGKYKKIKYPDFQAMTDSIVSTGTNIEQESHEAYGTADKVLKVLLFDIFK